MAERRQAVAGRLASLAHALRGLGFVLATQPNARIHLVATAAVLLLGWFLGISAMDWRWLLVAIGMVWVAEILNTALEHLCDVVSPDHRESVRRAKDVAAAGVLVAALVAAILGLLVFLPYLAAG